MPRIYSIILIFIVFLCFSCTSEENENSDNSNNEPKKFEKGQVSTVIDKFSSPVEMAVLIKQTGAPFSKKLLMPTDNSDFYITNFQKALGLGMLGVDLGYLNMYHKTTAVINYLSIIKNLAEGLQVGQFFNFAELQELASDDNIDSLLYVSTNSFNQMDNYLSERGQGDLSKLIIAGVWIEGLYLATQVVKSYPNQDIKNRIGEQKPILSEIILLLETKNDNAEFKKLISDLKILKNAFNDIRITIKKGKPELIERDSVLILEGTDVSTIEITEEQLNNIIEKTEVLRNKLIGS